MNPLSVTILLLAGSLAARAVAQEPAARFTPDLAAPALLFDEPGDGSVWAVGTTYKATSDGETFTYAPFFGSRAPRNYPLRLRLSRVTCGGEPLPVQRGTAERKDRSVHVPRGACTELYEFTETTVEQSFVFSELPARGDLVLVLDAESELGGKPEVDGIGFGGDLGTVHYRHALAFDAAGARLPLSIGWAEGRITLAVPAEFVATCRLPLVVDPILTTTTVAQTTYDEDSPAIAFSYSDRRYVAVWQRHYSATDRDVFGQRFDAAMVPVGARFTIDVSFDSWDHARVATVHYGGVALAVAQVTPSAGGEPAWISGRTVPISSGTPNPVIVIERQGVAGHFDGNKTAPEVGGDASSSGPSLFTVIWCREVAPGNRDIHFKQVYATGNLRTAAPVVVEATAADEHSPTISAGNGYWVAADQRLALAWVRTVLRGGAPDGDVRAAVITRYGVIEALVNGSPVALDVTSNDDAAPAVSSLLDSDPTNFCYLCTFTRKVGAEKDVMAVVFDSRGTVRSLQNLSQLGNAPAGVEQASPSVDSDATRFVVAYTEGSGSATRTYASLLAFDHAGNRLVVQENRTLLGSGPYRRDARIVARAATGPAHTHYAIAQTLLPAGGKRHVEALLFDGARPGGYTIRPTGCGGLTITPQGDPAIGQYISFPMSKNYSIGLLLGAPATTPLPCSGCTLGVANPVLLPVNYLSIPADFHLVGAVVAVQGFHVGSGMCLASVAFSDTVDVKIR